jgi:dimethylamine monooxygenase subunit A
VKLGFSVEELLPKARGGGPLKMGLAALGGDEWLQPNPDLAARSAAFDAFSEGVQLTAEAEAPARELAAIRGVSEGLEAVARSQWEDVCLLTREREIEPYRLVGAAVAFPTDWRPAEKLGLPLVALHKPIHGYADQLASGVDHFMGKLKPGAIYGRCNWFVSPTDALRWVGEPPERAFAHVTADNAGETLFVRSERQTLRKLPQTGAIVFTIGVYVAPLGTLSRGNIARLAEAVATVPPEEAERRGADHFAAALQEYAANVSPIRHPELVSGSISPHDLRPEWRDGC